MFDAVPPGHEPTINKANVWTSSICAALAKANAIIGIKTKHKRYINFLQVYDYKSNSRMFMGRTKVIINKTSEDYLRDL